MGGTTFTAKAKGKTANDAFEYARAEAFHEYGHRGYTGTIAEKNDFTVIPLPEGTSAEDFAQKLIDDGDPRIDDKWGPAGCIEVGDDTWLFFGWASC
jgi:hypothetical protein